MTEAIVVAIISGCLTLLGTVITVVSTSKRQQTQMETKIAVIDQRISDLTRSVEKHNNFAQRMPVVEEQIKAMNQKISDLEQYHKQPIN